MVQDRSSHFATPTVAERCPGVVWRGEIQIVLDLTTVAGSRVARHHVYIPMALSLLSIQPMLKW